MEKRGVKPKLSIAMLSSNDFQRTKTDGGNQ